MTEPKPLRRNRRRKADQPRPSVPSVEDFITSAIANPMQPPPRRPRNPNHPSGAWAKLKTPEERTALGRRLRARVKPENLHRKGRPAGVPNGWKPKDFARAQAEAARQAEAMIALLSEQGRLPDHLLAQLALQTALEIVFTPCAQSIRISAARMVLEFTKPRPTKAQVRFAEAEAWLEELAAMEGSDH